MDDYINRKALIEHIKAHCGGCDNCGEVMHCAWDTPAADVKAVTMARWITYEDDTPQCSSCGMPTPFARYRRRHGTNAREITDYCPSCGKKMTAMPMCGECSYGNGKWKDDGICYACREQVWIPGRPHRKAGEED